MKKTIILGAFFFVLGMAIAAALPIHAQVANPQFNYSVPGPSALKKKLSVSKVNAKSVTNIFYENDMSGQYITKIWDGTSYCYLYNNSISCTR